MSPEAARAILAAWRNERTPPRTIGARIRDAINHINRSNLNGQKITPP